MFIIRRINGESMLPTLKPGQIVIGTKCYKTIQIGNIVVFKHNGIEKIKRVSSIGDNGVFVLGDNTSASTDSRQFGLVPHSAVIAKVIRPRYLRHEQPQEQLLVRK